MFGTPPIAWDSEIFLSAMECLKWWRQNQGSKAPFIRLECYQPKNSTYPQSQELYLTHEDMIQLFVEHLSSAQYLDVAEFALYMPKDEPIDSSSSRVPYSDLQSLATSLSYPKMNQSINSPFTAYNFHLEPMSSFYIGPNLRRLRLHHVELVPDLRQAFTHWSLFRLTHISLQLMYMAPDVWYSFIRGVPNLQWGYFEIFLHRPSNKYPPPFTLPYLDTLSVTLDNSDNNVEGEPFSQLLTNLHLPALRDLSVYIDADPWSFPLVAMKVNDGLKSAPAVSKLTIAFQFFGFTEFTDPHIGWDEVDKLPMLVPDLTHLVLDTCYMRGGFEYDATLSRRLAYWTQFLSPTRWLDLDSPASTLRKISVVVKDPSREGPVVEGAFRRALELEEAGHDKETKVVLEIIPEDKRGLAPYADGYKTWGCSL
jgi:hypothetical protein